MPARNHDHDGTKCRRDRGYFIKLTRGWRRCRWPRGGRARRPFLLEQTRSLQDALEPVVVLVAGILEDSLWIERHRVSHGPGPGPRRWILDGVLVDQRVGIGPGETFRQLQRLIVGAAEGRLIVEVGRF